MQTGLQNTVLAQIWYLSDIDTGEPLSNLPALAYRLVLNSSSWKSASLELICDFVHFMLRWALDMRRIRARDASM